MHLDDLTLAEHGARLFRAALRPRLGALLDDLALLPSGQAGVRIAGLAALGPHLAPEHHRRAGRPLPWPAGQPVRAILFDKTAETNWSLAWHQDRTICLKERIEVEGFGPWSVKAGLHHVAPPFSLLARMVTLRIHLDDTPAANAPLLIAPGSHALGKVPEGSIEQVVARCGSLACLAEAGDAATPRLHASQAAACPARRRVLQVDFSADRLPGGLEWLGV
jgi:hypothetical protein